MRGRLLSIVSLSAAALIAMACGSDSVGSAQLVEPADAGPIIVRPSDTFTVDSFVKAGWKKSREQDVSSLERAPSGWYGFFNKRDIELWVYETNEDATSVGAQTAKAATDKFARGIKAFANMGSHNFGYADYIIVGNIVMLCESDVATCEAPVAQLD